MKYFLPAFSGLLITALFSCNGNTTPETTGEEAPKIPTNETFEQRTKREIEAKLSIPATEKYSMRIYKAYINADTIQDAIITVNRMEYAMDEAIKSKRTAKAAELGYIGNYNYFFFYDGVLDALSDAILAPSSPMRELDVTFESITSPTKKDIIIEYRIRNSGWKSYFTASTPGKLSMMFQWKYFDYVGEEHPEALNHVFDASPEGVMKDISIYESAIDNHETGIKDVYKFVPKITKKGALQYRFFYDPSVLKYRIYTKEMLQGMGLNPTGEYYKTGKM
jgi:hypothetical protein